MLHCVKSDKFICRLIMISVCLWGWPLDVIGETVSEITSGTVSPATQTVEKSVVGESLPADLEKILGWLPADTESIIVSRSFKIEKEWFSDDREEESDLISGFRQLTVGLLFIDGEKTEKQLGGVQVALAIHGARNFHLPTGLGGNRYEGCTIAMFAEPHHAVCKDLMDSLRSSAGEVTKISGSEVLIFKDKMEQDIWTFFLTSPSPGILLCATQREYLETVLDRMKAQTPQLALTGNLLEWKHVDVDAPVWALRHFDESKKRSLPKEVDPIFLENWGDRSDRQVRGLVLNLEKEGKQVGHLHYMSENPEAKTFLKRLFESQDVCPSVPLRVKNSGSGMVLLEIPKVNDLDCAVSILWIVMALFGHMVSL